MTRARRNPPDGLAATIHDRRTGAEVARLDPRHGLTSGPELRDLSWSEVERRYQVRPLALVEVDARVRAALKVADDLPAVQADNRRREVDRLGALVAEAVARLP